MVARIPKETVRSCLEQSVCEERPVSEIDGSCQIRPHPPFGSRTRLGGGADVDEGHCAVGGRANDLRGAVDTANKADVESLGLIHNVLQRRFEQRRIDEAINFQVLTKIVCRVRQIDRLSEPNSKLGIREGERIILLCLSALLLSSSQGGRPRIPAFACHSRRGPTLPILSLSRTNRIYRGCTIDSSSEKAQTIWLLRSVRRLVTATAAREPCIQMPSLACAVIKSARSSQRGRHRDRGRKQVLLSKTDSYTVRNSADRQLSKKTIIFDSDRFVAFAFWRGDGW